MKTIACLLLAGLGATAVRADAPTPTEPELLHFTPAPGRTDGRVYYFIPAGLDRSRPAPLLVFLHGGDSGSPDCAPENYFGPKGCVREVFRTAPFLVAAPSAPPAPHGSRWNQAGVRDLVEATIADAVHRFAVAPDRVFLGGHSMGCYGAYHLGQLMADRFAGVWLSAGAWWETDFRAFLGTPVYLQHGARDCSPAPGFHPGRDHARKHHWCGVDFARGAHALMLRDRVEHVYDEHAGGHPLSFPQAQEAIRRFFAWSADKRRAPYARRTALVTPCGTRHPGAEDTVRSRWLEFVKIDSDRLTLDAIALEGPDVARSEDDLRLQTHRLEKRVCPQGARLVAENLGGNRFRVEAENVHAFRILLAPEMGDLEKPFSVACFGRTFTLTAQPLAGDRDYSAALTLVNENGSRRRR